jgi:hypothetical protein
VFHHENRTVSESLSSLSDHGRYGPFQPFPLMPDQVRSAAVPLLRSRSRSTSGRFSTSGSRSAVSSTGTRFSIHTALRKTPRTDRAFSALSFFELSQECGRIFMKLLPSDIARVLFWNFPGKDYEQFLRLSRALRLFVK